MLRPFACDLFLRKPISRLMSDDFLAVELGQTLQQVSRLLTSRARQRIEEDFIVTRGGHYAGMGRVIDVLRLITEEKLQQARHANPLTLLPGNVPIQQCLERLLQQRREAVICYIDVDSFKPFNDLGGLHYGLKSLTSTVWICKCCGGTNRAELAPCGDSAKSARARVDLTLQCCPRPHPGRRKPGKA